MNLFKEILSEIFVNNLKPGIYDNNGTYIKGIIGSNRNRNGNKDNMDNNYLLPTQIIGLFKNTGWPINLKLFNGLRDKPNVYFPPTGYVIDKTHKKYDVYSYNRFCAIMLYGFNEGKPVKDNQGRYMLSNIGQELYNTYIINAPKVAKKRNDNEKWLNNLEIRKRYDKSEDDDE